MASSSLVYKASNMPFLIRRVLLDRGWSPARDGEDWRLYWKNGRFKKAEFEALAQREKDEEGSKDEEGRFRFNHFPHTNLITQKGYLQFLLKSCRWQHGPVYDFFPMSFAFTRYNDALVKKYFGGSDRTWIGKPPASSRGRGITITKDMNEFSKLLERTDDDDTELSPTSADAPSPAPTSAFASLSPMHTHTTARPRQFGDVIVVQDYITNPHLVAGYKHDLRLYVVVTSFFPLKAYLYMDGMSRFCTEKYSYEDMAVQRHLTNTSIQSKIFRKDENQFSQFTDDINNSIGKGDFGKRRARSFLSYLQKQKVDHEEVWNRIRNVIRLTLLPLSSIKIDSSSDNHFELLGFDLMLTDDYEVKLIEVNLAPSLGVGSPLDFTLKQPLVGDLLDLLYPDAAPDGPRAFGAMSPIRGPNTEYTEPHRVGNLELLFPFSEESAAESANLVENEEAMKKLVNMIKEQRGPIMPVGVSEEL